MGPLDQAVFVPMGGLPVDHMGLPSHMAYTPPPLPYLCNEAYDGGSLSGYPARQNWTVDDIKFPEDSGKSAEEIASFFQNWFFWGLLETSLRKPVHVSDFVRNDRIGRVVVTTKNLPEMTSDWIIRSRQLSDTAQQKHIELVIKNHRYICNFWNEWFLEDNVPFDEWTAVYYVMISEYIAKQCAFAYNKARDRMEAATLILFQSGECKYTIMDMVSASWCPSDLNQLFSRRPLHHGFYGSLIRAPSYQPAIQNEIISHEDWGKAHQKCSEWAYYAYQWNEQEYRPKHVSPNCTCEALEVNVGEVISILEEGKVPNIHMDSGIRISPAVPSVPYVAISHVWSDGLGNPRYNALPLCQLERISSLVRNLYPESKKPVPFWMDTLCCPIEPRDARNTAIQLMKKTYEEASIVLVLDSYLLSIPSQSARELELLMIVYCSRWNRRLWTLQERILGRDRVFVQFSDVALALNSLTIEEKYGDIMELVSMQTGKGLRVMSIMMSAPFLPFLMSMLTQSNWASADTSTKLDNLLRLLKFRATTKPSDEAVCLGNIFDMDITSILSASKEERMEKFWSSMPIIPASVIFVAGPKLTTKGFRWAPSTFLGNEQRQGLYWADDKIANRTKMGLKVRYPGWRLKFIMPGERIKKAFPVVTPYGEIFSVICSTEKPFSELVEESIDPWLLETGCKSPAQLYVLFLTMYVECGSRPSVLILAHAVEDGGYFARCVSCYDLGAHAHQNDVCGDA